MTRNKPNTLSVILGKPKQNKNKNGFVQIERKQNFVKCRGSQAFLWLYHRPRWTATLNSNVIIYRKKKRVYK